MTRRASLSLLVRVALAGAWAGLLALVGLWLLIDWPGRFPDFAILCRVAGVTLIAMGQFVLAALVADRLYPAVWPPVRLAVEGASAIVFMGGLGILGVVAWRAFS